MPIDDEKPYKDIVAERLGKHIFDCDNIYFQWITPKSCRIFMITNYKEISDITRRISIALEYNFNESRQCIVCKNRDVFFFMDYLTDKLADKLKLDTLYFKRI